MSKNRYSNPNTLRHLAFDEFYTAALSGRLICFTGSYANLAFGYPSWNDSIDEYLSILANSGDIESESLGLIKTLIDSGDSRTKEAIDFAEYVSKCDKSSSQRQYIDNRNKFSKQFKLTGSPRFFDQLPNVNKAIFDSLGVKRIMTLNYDLELEWNKFVSVNAGKKSNHLSRHEIWENFSTQWEENSTQGFKIITEDEGEVVSDILNRTSSETLMEFAMSFPARQTKILHLHGRQDQPEHLLLSQRDYRDLYWQDGTGKRPIEYGLNSIFAGNPVLFIGIGLSEAEIMDILRQHMSDSPLRLKNPHFVIWNSYYSEAVDGTKVIDRKKNNVKRLQLYRNFGIHILFDAEISEALGSSSEKYFSEVRKDAAKAIKLYEKELLKEDPVTLRLCQKVLANSENIENAYRLVKPIQNLGSFVRDRAQFDYVKPSSFRSTENKIKPNDISTYPYTNRIDLWDSPQKSSGYFESERKPKGQHELRKKSSIIQGVVDEKWLEEMEGFEPLTLIVADPGTGKGTISNTIANLVSSTEDHGGQVMVINAAFATETDSIFHFVSGCFDGRTAQLEGKSRPSTLEDFFDMDRSVANQKLKDNNRKQVCLIINGMERFIGEDGKALSIEVDNIIRRCAKKFDDKKYRDCESQDHPFKLILIGTKRLERYISKISDNYTQLNFQRPMDVNEPRCEIFVKDPLLSNGRRKLDICFAFDNKEWNYFERLKEIFSDIIPNLNVSDRLDFKANRKYILSQILQSSALLRAGIEDPALAMRMLQTMAFVGQPIEECVFRHDPAIGLSSISEKPKKKASLRVLSSTLKKLVKLNLCLEISEFSTNKLSYKRYTLHKSVMTEIRSRHGVPLSDAKLAGSFNLTLYAAQPVDSYIPESHWHGRLGELTGHLTSSYKDSYPLKKEFKFNKSQIQAIEKVTAQYGTRKYTSIEVGRLARPETAACLRAALSLLRNYYSTTASLIHGHKSGNPLENFAPLSEHARRIRRLLRVSRVVIGVREEIRNSPIFSEIKDKIGPEPFYADDLAWLYNELGVVELTLGRLYGAEHAFIEALQINRNFIEHGEKIHNWRRIQTNRLQLLIDRGRIEDARDLLRKLDSVIEAHVRRFGRCIADGESTSKRKMVEKYTTQEPFASSSKVDREYPTDLIMNVGLCLGYEGLCNTLRGSYETATKNYSDCLEVLNRLEEKRGYSLFQKHASANYVALNRRKAASRAIELSMHAAGATRQADIDHQARIADVALSLHINKERGVGPIPQLLATLNYALANEMHRVQLEVLQVLALIHKKNGDYDSALNYVSEAIGLASRFGYGLRKVSLRNLLASILIMRGDKQFKISALKLLDTATKIGTKIGYNTAVERAENIRVSISL